MLCVLHAHNVPLHSICLLFERDVHTHDNDIDLEGACGGELACSTCHVILPQEVFDGLPEPDEEEEDMLDLALGLTDTSRLGCQVCVTAEHQNLEVILPEETADMR